MYDSTSMGAQRYFDLAEEIMRHGSGTP